MAPLRVRLGQAVRELRTAAGYSQERFAGVIDVHRTFMGTIERGNTNVSLDTLERIAAGLGLSVWELLRIAELGTGATERRGSPYRRDSGRPSVEGAPRRKVAEDRDR